MKPLDKKVHEREIVSMHMGYMGYEKNRKIMYGFVIAVAVITCIILFSMGIIQKTTVLAAESDKTSDEYDIEFTKEELEYIENSKKIRVALYGDRNILSSYDEKNNSFSGITYQIMKLIEKKNGLKFEYSLMPDGMRGVDFFDQDKGDIIAPLLVNKYTKLSENVETIELGYTSSKVIVGRKGFEFNADDSFNIVLNVNFIDYDTSLKAAFPNAVVKYLDTQNECMQYVLSGKADVTLDNRLAALYRLRSPYYTDELTIYDSWNEPEELTILISKDTEPVLKSVLQKTAAALSNEEITDIVVDNTSSVAYAYSFPELLYRFRYYIIAGMVVLGVIVCLLVFVLILVRKDRKHKREEKYNQQMREADEKYKKQLYRQANYDSMTGLLNRNGFYEKTRNLLDENRNTKFIILRGDIDQFKVFNDIMGVHVGDELIRYVADKWRTYFDRQLGTYGYLGGDDYICCYPYESFDKDTVMRVVEKWFEKFKSSYTFSVSVGGYIVDDADIDVNIMCDRAELALSKAKKNKDMHICIYEDYMREQLIKEREIISYIPTAFEQEQFEIYLQPQYNSETGKIIGAEALTRWNHPENGIVSPGIFIPIMEENGLITTMDKYVVEHVCDIINKLTGDMVIDDEFSIAVNLSRIDTFNNKIIDWIIDTLDKKNVPMKRVRLEITESAYIEQQAQVSDFVRELKGRGFIIEMDDFGSGYSSLNTLKDVPVDTLKLDLKFLAGDNTGKGGIIINSVIRMARWMDIPVIAEGVETVSQAEYLRSIGCHYMQGYYFSKPIRVAEFVELLKNNGSDGIIRREYTESIKDTERLLDPNNMSTNIFEKIGPMVIVEFWHDNLEAIMQNDEFFQMLGTTRGEFEKYSLHIQDCFSEKNRTELIDTIKSLKEKQAETIDSEMEREGIICSLRIHIRVLSTLKNRKTVMLLFDFVNS